MVAGQQYFIQQGKVKTTARTLMNADEGPINPVPFVIS